MKRWSHQKKAKLAKGLAIASAAICILTYILNDMLKENLKALRDSLVSAEMQFDTAIDQSTISKQILVTQQQIEALRLESIGKRNKKNFDYSNLIQQDIAQAQQVKSQMDVDFDAVSRLIDKLPSGAGKLRDLRNQLQENVKKMDAQVTDMLKPTQKHDVWRLVDVKVAMVLALVQEIPIFVLGDDALTASRRVKEAAEARIRRWTIVTYVLFFLSVSLGLFSVLSGIKIQSPE